MSVSARPHVFSNQLFKHGDYQQSLCIYFTSLVCWFQMLPFKSVCLVVCVCVCVSHPIFLESLINYQSVDLTAKALARSTQVVLSVDGHLGERVFFKLLVACRAWLLLLSATVGSVNAVRGVRLLGPRATCRLSCTAIFIANCISLNSLHAHHLHLVVRSSSQSARLRVAEIGVPPLRTRRSWLIQNMVRWLVGHQDLVSCRSYAFAVDDVALLHIGEHTEATLGWNQTADHFLRHILS